MAPVRIVGDGRAIRAILTCGQTPAGPIIEVPPLVADRFGQVMPMGWGWGLRMSSPRRVLRAIEAVNRAGAPAVLTVHPWELDPDPPRVRLPARLQFAHYFRLERLPRPAARRAAPQSRSAVSATIGRSRLVPMTAAHPRVIAAARLGRVLCRASCGAAATAAQRADTAAAPRIAIEDDPPGEAARGHARAAAAPASRFRSPRASHSRRSGRPGARRAARRARRRGVPVWLSLPAPAARGGRRGVADARCTACWISTASRAHDPRGGHRSPAGATRALRGADGGDRGCARATKRSGSRSAGAAMADRGRREDDLHGRAGAVRRPARHSPSGGRAASPRGCSQIDPLAAHRR